MVELAAAKNVGVPPNERRKYRDRLNKRKKSK